MGFRFAGTRVKYSDSTGTNRVPILDGVVGKKDGNAAEVRLIYCGNWRTLVTWSPWKRTKSVFEGG
jgi:hypothetical protein